MTVNDAITDLVKDILKKGKYCSSIEAEQIAERAAQQIYDILVNNEIKELNKKTRYIDEQLDRLWNTIDAMRTPKHPKIDSFIRFGWLKFWKK